MGCEHGQPTGLVVQVQQPVQEDVGGCTAASDDIVSEIGYHTILWRFSKGGGARNLTVSAHTVAAESQWSAH